MSVDPRVQKFYDEARTARKELQRLATMIASHRLECADMPTFPTGRMPLATAVIPDMTWSLETGRTDLAARIIELVDQYNNSMATAAMMEHRLALEAHQRSYRENLGADSPDYLSEPHDAEPIRLSAEEAASRFGSHEP